MLTRGEWQKELLKCPNMLDLSILYKTKSYLMSDGLYNTVHFLKKKEEKKMINLLNEVLDIKLEDRKVEEIENSKYIEWERNALRLVTEAIRFLEAGIIAEKSKKMSSSQNKKNKDEIFYRKGNYSQCNNWKKYFEEKKVDVYQRQLEKRIGLLYKFYKDKGYIPVTSKENEGIFVKSREGSRLIVGLGTPSVTETGISVEFLYGIPILPATAIKGVFRHFCEDKLSESQKTERSAGELLEKEIESWFGSKESEGRLIFLDSIPKKYEIFPDIIANHYQKYYDNRNKCKYPIQEEPKPISYKSLKIQKMEIKMILESEKEKAAEYKTEEEEKEQIEKKQPEKKKIVRTEAEKIYGLFCECLKECGFGAKTSVGYGYLEQIKERTK